MAEEKAGGDILKLLAQNTATPDLPLEKSAGTAFLKGLTALMTTLGVLAAAGIILLSHVSYKLSSGVSHRATLEIPAEDKNGAMISSSRMDALSKTAQGILSSHPAVKSAEILSDEDISELVSPWLGDDMKLDGIPVPGIITIIFQEESDVDIKKLESRLQSAVPNARLDTHENWLDGVLRFTSALQAAAVTIALLIGVTIAGAVAGAVTSKMALHRDELELLHLMGASDRYVTRQFEIYILWLSIRYTLAGCAMAGVLLAGLCWLADISMTYMDIALLGLVPVAISLMAYGVTRFTVLRALSKMP